MDLFGNVEKLLIRSATKLNYLSDIDHGFLILIEKLTIEIDDVILFTDSMIALSWVRSKARNFKMFIATRVGEIQSNTDPSKWRHISGVDNIADVLSRGLKASELKGSWQHGSDFLQQSRSDRPEEVKVLTNLPDVEKERPHEKTVLAVSRSCDLIDYERFSNWRKLVRVATLVLKFVKKLKARRVRTDVEKIQSCGVITT